MYSSNLVMKYGSGNVKEVANNIARITNETIYKEYPDVYSNISVYIQSGKFPTAWIGGNLSFDFRKLSSEDKKELDQKIKQNVIVYFKELFPELFLDIKFNISLEPSKFDILMRNKRFTSTGSVSYFYPLTEQEFLVMDLSSVIETKLYSDGVCGKDYVISVDNDTVHINQVFYNNSTEDLKIYSDFISDYYSNLDLQYEYNLLVNNEQNEINNVRNNKFGSMIFHNSSGYSGTGNDFYGFISSQRPFTTNKNFGSSVYDPSIALFPKVKEIAYEEYESTKRNVEVTLTGFMGDSIDNYQTTTNFVS